MTHETGDQAAPGGVTTTVLLWRLLLLLLPLTAHPSIYPSEDLHPSYRYTYGRIHPALVVNQSRVWVTGIDTMYIRTRARSYTSHDQRVLLTYHGFAA